MNELPKLPNIFEAQEPETAELRVIRMMEESAISLTRGGLQEYLFCHSYCSDGRAIADATIAKRRWLGSVPFKKQMEALDKLTLYSKLKDISLGIFEGKK